MKALLQLTKDSVKKVLKAVHRIRRQFEVKNSAKTITLEQLITDIAKLGIKKGDTLFVHSSLKSLGYVEGGPRTLIEALYQVVSPSGTIIFPTYYLPGGTIYATCKMEDYIFDPRKHGTNIGRLPEAVLKYPGVERSLHPTHSVSAIGANSKFITEAHHLAPSVFGEGSPWARFLELKGKVLGLGVSMGPITFYHMLEDSLADDFPLPVRMAECQLKCRNENNEVIEVPIRPLDIDFLPRRIDNKGRSDLREYFWQEFTSKELLTIAQVGQSTSWAIDGNDFYRHLERLNDEGITIYATPEQLAARPI